MAVENPSSYIQTGSHTAEQLRRLTGALTGDQAGIINADDLKVTQNATPNMTVTVAAGRAVLVGDEATYQGTYVGENRSDLSVSIAASDPTNPRIDLIVAKQQDSAYSGGTDAFSIVAVTGTPAGSPAAPSAPDSSIVLAQVAVAAAATTITNANITDLRPVSRGSWRSSWGVLALASTATSTASSSTSLSDITGLSATTASIPAGRRLKITLHGEFIAGTDGNVADITFTDGSNTIKNKNYTGAMTGSAITLSFTWYETSTGGTVTRKARIARAVGSGSVSLFATTNRIAQLVIEDVGAA